MKKSFLASCLLIVMLGILCCKAGNSIPVLPISDTNFFARGADIGWLSEMEASGITFHNADGSVADCIDLLKSKGINALRFRVWVNPKNGWCGEADLVKQTKRAQKAGMKIMIDFHYSDYWADPGKQNKPSAWLAYTPEQLNEAVYQHTQSILMALKSNSVIPDWVQVGNETNDGMLWEEGRASKNMVQFAAMLKAGAKAVKENNAQTKVIIHISNGHDNALFRWLFDGLVRNGLSWDVIAMSLYPTPNNWSDLNNQCLANMKDMILRYNKEIMISEVGMDVTQPNICKQFLRDIIAKTRSLPANKGLGVFYWEPESHNKWQGYTLGAFDDKGTPTVALDAFKD